MKHASWWSTSVATLGSVIAVAATLHHYIDTQKLDSPGGYLPLGLGAATVGLLAGAGGYFSIAPSQRRIAIALAVAFVVALITAGVLTATLIWTFGS